MYLAEDRILCWELVSKRGGAWILHYVKSAYAITDVPDEVAELISQRRRWLNGSFFAAIHSIVKFGYIYRSEHTFARKAWIHVEMFYQTFNLIFSWFALGNYYVSFVSPSSVSLGRSGDWTLISRLDSYPLDSLSWRVPSKILRSGSMAFTSSMISSNTCTSACWLCASCFQWVIGLKELNGNTLLLLLDLDLSLFT